MDDTLARVEEDSHSFSLKSNAFLTWLQSRGATISSKIEITDLRSRGAGRGVVATQPIAEDEELFSIPRASILTASTSSLHLSTLTEVGDDPWLSLILALVYEHRQERNSSWHPYLDILPTQFDTPMFWNELELMHLQGSAVVDKVGKESADALFTSRIIPIIRANERIFAAQNLKDDEILQICHRMGSTIMAYAFDLETTEPFDVSEDEPQKKEATNHEQEWELDSSSSQRAPLAKGMVPLADLLNADAERNNAKLFYSDANVIMRATQPIQPGEEIFNDYGPLPRADLLRRYGYVTDNYAPYDVAELPFTDIEALANTPLIPISPSDFAQRIEYLDSHGIIDDAYDITHPEDESRSSSSLPEEICILVNTLLASPAEFETLRRRDSLPKSTLSSPKAREFLYTLLAHRYARYSLDDKNSCPPNRAASAPSHRIAMAQQVIRGEKLILCNAAAKLRSEDPSMRDACVEAFEAAARSIQAEQRKNVSSSAQLPEEEVSSPPSKRRRI